MSNLHSEEEKHDSYMYPGEPISDRQLLHKWLGGQVGYFLDKFGYDTVTELLRVVERRRPNG